MLNITGFSTNCVKFDMYADYIPVVSTVTNIVDLALQHIVRPYLGQESVKNNHYFTYLEGKTSLRSIMLLVPVVGNIFIGISDLVHDSWAQNCLHHAPGLDDGHRIRLYKEAAMDGSVEGSYRYGEMISLGVGINQEYLNDPKVQNSKNYALRFAAARGCEKAQVLLQQDSDNCPLPGWLQHQRI